MSTPLAHIKALRGISIKALEYFLKAAGLILLLIFIFIALIRAEFVQNWTKGWVVKYLDEHYQQQLEIKSFYLDPFSGFNGALLVRDHHQDTLFYSSGIQIGLIKSLRSLFSRQLFLDAIACDSVVFKVVQYAGEPKTNLDIFINKFKNNKATTTNAFRFNFKHLILNNARASYLDNMYYGRATINKLDLLMDSLNYTIKYFNIRKLLLDKPIIEISKTNGKLPLIDPISFNTNDSCAINASVFLQFFNINEGSINYTVPINSKDSSLIFSNLNLTLKNAFHGDHLDQIEFLHANVKSSDDFAIKNIAIKNLKWSYDRFVVDDLLLETLLSSLQFQLSSDLAYSEQRNLDLKNTLVNMQLTKGLFDFKDIDKLFPNYHFSQNFNLQNGTAFNLKGKLFGKLNNLKGSNIKFDYSDQFNFIGNVGTRNLFRKDKMVLNLKIDQLITSAPFLRNLFYRYNIPLSYNRFGQIRMHGQFDGYLNDFVAYGSFNTAIGVIRSDIKVNFNNNTGNGEAQYSGGIVTSNLNLGALLQIKDLGLVNSEIKILDGSGLSANTISAQIDGKVNEIVYKNYPYKGISIKGLFKKSKLQGDLKVEDDNVQLQITGSFLREQNKNSIKLTGDIRKLNLKALNITTTEVSYTGHLNVDVTKKENEHILGSFALYKSNMLIRNEALSMDRFLLEEFLVEGKNQLHLYSDIFDFDFVGSYNPQSVLSDFTNILVKRYPVFEKLVKVEVGSSKSILDGKGSIHFKNARSLFKILNYPFEIDHSDFDFSLSNVSDYFDLNSNRFDFKYKALEFEKFSINLKLKQDFNSTFTADYFRMDGKTRSGIIKCKTNLFDSIGKVSLLVYDSTNTKIQANLNSNIIFNHEFISAQILNEDLFFNNVRWRIDQRNIVKKSKLGLEVVQFELSDSLHFLSISDIEKKGLAIKSDGFDISFVNQFIRNKSISFSGLFASDLVLPDLKNLNGLHGQLNFFQLHFNKDNFGPFGVKFIANDIMKPWDISVENVFREHIIRGNGTINIPIVQKNYNFKPFDFSLDLNVKSFPFKFLENFISSISKTSGGADGQLHFYSVDRNLHLTGRLMAINGSTYINYLGVPVLFENQPIVFKENEILLSDIELLDKFKNPIKLNGRLVHNYFKTFAADIKLTSAKALILDTKKSDNIYYYGYGLAAVDVRFLGPFSAMDMDVKVTSLKSSKFNIPVTYDQVATESKFVRFASKNSMSDSLIKPTPFSIIGLNLNMQLSITEDAEISIIFDELAGDILKGRGRGNLSVKSLRTGAFTVNGLYEVEQGQYLFTLYNFVNKPFAIARGGTINWTGDPLNATIKLEAVYEGLSTSPYVLIQEYLGIDQRLIEEAKRRTDVKLKMMLAGSLISPEIKFDIVLPDLTGQLKNFADNKMRYLRSNQDQLNQQVFGLLVLRTFLNSFDPTEIGSNLSTTTINTMSEMLSNQFSLFVTSLLSNAFDDVNFISGVDFNIGYDLNNAIPGTAKLNEGEVVFSLKHRLWNDQWIVTLGGNYKSSNSSIYGNSYFNPESVIEWNTPVPGLKLRIYYRGDESIEGLKHKIGTGVSYRKEFDSFFYFKKELDSQIKNNIKQ